MPERTFDDFDEFATDYRSIHTDNIKISGADSFYFAEMKVRLLQEFEKNLPLRVLDVGCGDGTTQIFMSKYFPQWKITGIDVSDESIRQAKDKKIPNTAFSTYDGTHIPFEDGAFDVVFMAGVLHHVDYSFHKSLICEVNRVLKATCTFYLYEHNPLNPLTRHLVNTCVFDKDARLLYPSYTIKLLRVCSFSSLRKQFIIFFPRKGLLSKLIFLEPYLKLIPLGGQYFIRAKKAEV